MRLVSLNPLRFPPIRDLGRTGVLLAALIAASASTQVHAEQVYATGVSSNGAGLVLASFDSNTPGEATFVPITGLVGGDSLVDIDFRPSTGELYGLGFNIFVGQLNLYTIDRTSGALAVVAPLAADPSDTTDPYRGAFSGASMDFNPVADLAGAPSLRVTGQIGLNYRVNAETGLVITDASLAGGGAGRSTFGFGGVAYDGNDLNPATGTTLYGLGSVDRQPMLFKASDPIGGLYAAIGPVTVQSGAFDISATGTAYVIGATDANGRPVLGSLDLATGLVTRIGSIDGLSQVYGLTAGGVTAVPEPSSLALAGLGGLGLLGWARRRRSVAG